jgi:hypothetical protein
VATTKKEASGRVKPAAGVSASDVVRFMALFDGYSQNHGEYDMSKAKADPEGKVKGQAITVKGPATRALFEQHLRGTGNGLGVIMLRDDDTCKFAVIDYDNRQMDHVKAEARVKELKLPLILCRSKSGGGHFYVFLKEPVPALKVQERLAEWAAMLGMSAKTEIFPKQSARFNENDIGSWINLPYFDSAAFPRNAIIDGQPVSLSSFLDAAEANAVGPETFYPPEVAEAEDALFYEGPPCLQLLSSKGGFMEGSRNDGMLATIVYLKKRYPDDWEKHVDAYNIALAKLPAPEIVQLTKSNKKKSYNYACSKSPINAHCQRRACLGRLYGVGEGTPEAKGGSVVGLIRYDSANGDEPMWRMEVNTKPVMVSNSQFYSRDEFNRACMAQANIVPIHMPPQRWLRYLNELIATADVVKMPDDVGPTGQLWSHIENFCLQQVFATERAEMYLGKPYRETDKAGETRIYFRMMDLMRYLDSRKIQYKSTQHIGQLLRQHDATNGFWHVGNSGINWWSLPDMKPPIDDTTPELKFGTQEFGK